MVVLEQARGALAYIDARSLPPKDRVLDLNSDPWRHNQAIWQMVGGKWSTAKTSGLCAILEQIEEKRSVRPSGVTQGTR